MATKRDTQQVFAMKVLRKKMLLERGQQSVALAISENKILQELSVHPHPYIVTLWFAFQDAEHLYLVMDFVGGGDLFALINHYKRLPEEWVRRARLGARQGRGVRQSLQGQ